MDTLKELQTALDSANAVIEGQKKVISELKLRKEQYDSIMENMEELVERSDPEFSLLYVNKALADYYGFTQEELIGTDTMELVIEEDRPAIYEMMDYVNAENPYYHFEYRIKDEDGNLVWMESVGRGFYDENGEIIEYQDVGRDITHYKDIENRLTWEVEQRTKELKKTNNEVLRVNSYLQSILSGISEGIIVIDKNGDCEFLNYGPDGLWLDAEEDLSRHFKNLLNGEKSNVLNWLFLKKKAFWDIEMNCITKKKELSFIISGMPLESEEDMFSK